MSRPRKILIVEDDRDIARLAAVHLRDLGHEVEVVHDGRAGLERALGGGHHLIVLDLMLPSVDGLEICRKLREKGRYVPVLMLTAKSAEVDRVVGLELGADDYLTKPFSVRELTARVKSLFRRIDALTEEKRVPAGETIRRGNLEIDTGKRRVTKGGKRIPLTAREFDLLLHFARHPGRVFTRAQLLDSVWGYGHEGYEHTVNSHINRLRAKLEDDPARPRYVLTVWGVGYSFPDPPE